MSLSTRTQNESFEEYETLNMNGNETKSGRGAGKVRDKVNINSDPKLAARTRTGWYLNCNSSCVELVCLFLQFHDEQDVIINVWQ